MHSNGLFWIALAAMVSVLALMAVVKISQGRRGHADSPEVQELPKGQE